MPAFLVTPADSAIACTTPPDVPYGIAVYKQAWQNWSKEIVTDALLTCVAHSADDVGTLASWAHAQGHYLRARARGRGHGGSPLTITPDSECASKVVLVDATQFLNGMQVLSPAPGVSAVRTGTGTALEVLLAFLEQQGLGFATQPATGDITIGGMLAINGHGASLPAVGETQTPGHTYGSLSNMILSLTAVIWGEDTQAYRLRTYSRSHPHVAALLVHLGRAFITEVTLQVGPLQNIRCRSFNNVGVDELFAAPGSSGRTFSSYVEQTGRVEAIWFPYTREPWMKVWWVAPVKPLLSRKVTQPYNYLFSDNMPEQVADLAGEMLSGNAAAAPLFGATMLSLTAAGLTATLTADIWGRRRTPSSTSRRPRCGHARPAIRPSRAAPTSSVRCTSSSSSTTSGSSSTVRAACIR